MNPASGTETAAGDQPALAKPANVRKEAVESLILDIATRLFAQRGFAGTSLQDIADAMGVTRPALYYYVRSKDDLLQKLVADTADGYTNQIAQVALDPDIDAAAKLARVLFLVAHNRAVHPARFLLLTRSETELPEQLAEVHESSKHTVLTAVIGIIKEGTASGQFRPVDPCPAAFGVIGMCNWIAWWFHEDTTSTAEEVANDIAGLAVAGLVQTPLPTRPPSGPRTAAALLRRDLNYLEELLDQAEASNLIDEGGSDDVR